MSDRLKPRSAIRVEDKEISIDMNKQTFSGAAF